MYLILIVLSIVLKTKSVHLSELKVMLFGSLQLLPFKPDIVASLDPRYFLFLISFLRVYVRLHSPCVEAFVFLEIANVDLIF